LDFAKNSCANRSNFAGNYLSYYGRGNFPEILFCNGRPIETLVGYRPKETLKRELQLMIETQQDCFKQQTPLVK
jgi:hypothetical protein